MQLHGAPGQRLTVATMLPGCQMADDWLDFMLSQRNLWPSIAEKTFRKERRRLQAKHLWMEVKLSWNVLSDRMYRVTLTGKSREQLYELLFNRAATAKGIPKRKHTVDPPTKKSRHGGSNAKSGCCFTNANVHHWSWTLKAFCMHSGARKRMLVLRLMHVWIIAQSGGKPAQATTTLAGCERPV